MTLLQLLAVGGYALLVGFLLPGTSRLWAILLGSLVAIYWLQPPSSIRNIDYWLPSLSILLCLLVWSLVQPQGSGQSFPISDRRFVLFTAGVVLVIALTRYAGLLCCLTPSRPPDILRVSVLFLAGGTVAFLPRFRPSLRSLLLTGTFWLILAIFIILKAAPLATVTSGWLRQVSGQDSSLAAVQDLPWLGFSYLAFRLLGILRDSQSGKALPCSFGEFLAYTLFFPAFPAGPIDRPQRFLADLRNQSRPSADNLAKGGWRLLSGTFKKFVLADSLALMALNGQIASQTHSFLWAWVLLYAYALRIYFDFSGYTDIAIGLGQLIGIRLPENFDRPYLKENLTSFWNSWHITLAQWFRSYFFNPITRYLRTRPDKLPAWLMILIGQMGTMALIGLWHGITWNFLIWGAWHGLGLFIHSRWSDWLRPRSFSLLQKPVIHRLLRFGGWFITFHYVVLGWVWFTLPDPVSAMNFMTRLFALPVK